MNDDPKHTHDFKPTDNPDIYRCKKCGAVTHALSNRRDDCPVADGVQIVTPPAKEPGRG